MADTCPLNKIGIMVLNRVHSGEDFEGLCKILTGEEIIKNMKATYEIREDIIRARAGAIPIYEGDY